MSLTFSSPSWLSRRRETASYSYRPCCALVVDLMCHCSSGMFSEAATSSASIVLPVPGSPFTSRGRLSVMAAFTASIRSWVATYWSEPWNFMARSCRRSAPWRVGGAGQYRGRPIIAGSTKTHARRTMKKLIPAFSFALVAFLSQSALAQQAAAQEKGGDAAAGQTKAAMCIGCHSIPGYQASFPEVHKVPMIAGQNEKYIASALAAYKKGDRRHPTMRGIAESLSDQDMSDLAAYFAHLSAPADAPAQPAAPNAAVAELLKK